MWPHVLVTAKRYVVALSVGIPCGLLFSLISCELSVIRRVVVVAIELIRVIPPLILIPIGLVIVHSTERVSLGVVALYSALSFFVYTTNALQNIPRDYIYLSTVLGASRWKAIISVQLPAIVPELVGATRVTSALGLGILIVAEYLACSAGIGRVMKYGVSLYNVQLLFTGIMWATAIGVSVDLLVAGAFRHVVRWHSRTVDSWL